VKVLVTGASGFVGSALSRYLSLSESYEVQESFFGVSTIIVFFYNLFNPIKTGEKFTVIPMCD